MTYQTMTAAPIAELWSRQAELFARLNDAPILLTNPKQAAAVLVHPDTWNQLIEDIRHYQRLVCMDLLHVWGEWRRRTGESIHWLNAQVHSSGLTWRRPVGLSRLELSASILIEGGAPRT